MSAAMVALATAEFVGDPERIRTLEAAVLAEAPGLPRCACGSLAVMLQHEVDGGDYDQLIPPRRTGKTSRWCYRCGRERRTDA